jgi:hypothetical protein
MVLFPVFLEDVAYISSISFRIKSYNRIFILFFLNIFVAEGLTLQQRNKQEHLPPPLRVSF